jgi:MFS family permease
MSTSAAALPSSGTTAPEPMSMRAVLALPTMRRLWYAQIVSVFGDFVALFAVITVMTFKLHASPQQITGVQISYLLPIALLGVISGVFVDRWPLKPTLVCSDFLRAGLVLMLLVVHNFWGYYLALAAISVVSSVFSPAQGVAIRAAVPMHGQRSAQALMQQVMFIMRIIGGPIAAGLVAYASAKSCFLVDSASFVASGSLIASLALSLPATAMAEAVLKSSGVGVDVTRPKSAIAKVWADMWEALSFIVHHAALLFVIVALAAGMFVLGCFGPLIAVYVRDTLHASTKTFGFTSAMIGLGLLVGVNSLNALAKHVRNTSLVYFGLGGIAAGTAILAGVPHLYATLPGLFFIGFAVSGIVVPSQAMIQEETPPAMLGRVGSTVMSVIFTAQIAGLVLSGILASHTSVRRVFALCTVMLLVQLAAGKLWMAPKEHAAENVG